MFFGEYEHAIDDKSRITLPARFRDALADGVVLSKGLDGNVDVYPARGLGVGACSPHRRARSVLGRDPQAPAALLRRRRRGHAGQAGARARAGVTRRVRGAREGRRRRRCQRPPRDLGSRRLGGAPRGKSKGAPTMLPNVLPKSAADHTPVLADEVRELLAVRPGRPSSTRRSAPAVTPGCSPRTSVGSGKLVAIDRDPTVKSHFDRFKAGAGVDVRFLRGDFAIVLSQLAANDVKADAILLDIGVSSMQIDRPERGFSYATDAPLDMRMDPTSARPPRRSSTRGTSGSSPTIFRRFGEERYAGPIARAIVRRRDERALPHRRPRRRDQDGDPDAGAVRRGSPGQARLPGAAHRRQRRARAARGRAAGGARDAAARWPPRRDQLPLARGPDREAVLPERARGCTCPPDFPVCVCGKEPELRILTRSRCGPRRASSTTTRGLPRRGCVAREGLDMSTIEAAAAVESRRAARGRPRASRRRLGGGVAWIVVVGALLAGIVAVNVLVLQLNMQSRRAQQRAGPAEGGQRAASLAALERLGQRADRGRGRARGSGCSRPTPATEYVRIRRGRSDRPESEPPDPLPARRLRSPLRHRVARAAWIQG